MISAEPTHTGICVRNPASRKTLALIADDAAEHRGQHQGGDKFEVTQQRVLSVLKLFECFPRRFWAPAAFGFHYPKPQAAAAPCLSHASPASATAARVPVRPANALPLDARSLTRAL